MIQCVGNPLEEMVSSATSDSTTQNQKVERKHVDDPHKNKGWRIHGHIRTKKELFLATSDYKI